MSEIRDKVREKIAEWLFDNTDIIHWDLCGYELNESITKYEHLITPPEGFNFYEEDIERLRKMHQVLLEKADQILSIPELAIVDREAQPPIRFIHPDASGVLSYEQCKKDMLKTGWVKELK